MHDFALHLSRSDSWLRLPVAIGDAARLDVLLFCGAAAVVALHALVDAFVAPEPGTGPRDHLLRGLASLVLLALVALAYPRLSAGGRAALAAVLGILSLEGAGLAIADARAVGARGEDWSGFLLLPVGVAFLVVSAALIWRSRKPGRRRVVPFFERALFPGVEDTA